MTSEETEKCDSVNDRIKMGRFKRSQLTEITQSLPKNSL